MKIKNLQKSFEKVVKEQFNADGFARIDEVTIIVEADGKNSILIKGSYGTKPADGMIQQNSFELYYPDGKCLDFVSGMFYQFVNSDKPLQLYHLDGNHNSENDAADGEIV